MTSVWFILMILYNPTAGEYGEVSVEQRYYGEVPKQGSPKYYYHFNSYDECKSHLYKIMEKQSQHDWKMRKSQYDKRSIVLQRLSGVPDKNHLWVYTCNQFEIDKDKLE